MKFSFVITTYNYAHFLKRCVSSVLEQNFRDCEVIIVDDGSTDDTATEVNHLRQEYSQRQLHYIYQENAGPSAARNKGAVLAGAEYVWCLDADDHLIEGAIERMDRAAAQHPKAWFLFSGYRSVNAQGQVIENYPTVLGQNRTQNFRRYLLNKIRGLTTGSAIIRREAFEFNGYPEGIHNNEDTVFYAHLIARYPTVSVPGLVLETYRHPGSLRRNIQRIQETGLKTVDRLFDPRHLDPEQMDFRAVYLARRSLSLFRSYQREGHLVKARHFYEEAIRQSPRLIVKWPYLWKYLKCRLKASD
jgi:glycosyltransferase involved in cell wall biosynthesis